MFNTLNVNTTTTGVVATYEIAPLQFYQQGSSTFGTDVYTYRCYPPACHLAYLFNQWRGSVKLKFLAVKTQLVTARFSIQFNNATTSIGTEDENFTAPRYIWDIASSDSIVVECPWMIAQNYLAMNEPSGNLTFSVLNELKVNASCADNIDILVYVSFGTDFELEAPISSAPNPIFVLPASDNVVDDQIMGNQVISDSSTKYAEVGVGEHFNTVKQIISRYNTVPGTSTLSASVSVNPYFFSAVSSNATTGAYAHPTYGGDVLSYVGLMYGAYRGSLKVGTVVANSSYPFQCSLRNSSTSSKYVDSTYNPFTGVNWHVPGSGPPLNMGCTTVRGSSVYVRVPYYVDTLFSTLFPTITDIASTHPDQPYVWANMFTTIPNTDYVSIVRAASDDFVLSNFVCTPLVLISRT